MEKRKLSAIPRPIATPEMIEIADRLGDMRHIVTAELIDDKKNTASEFLRDSGSQERKNRSSFPDISVTRRLYHTRFENVKDKMAYSIIPWNV